jgi:hypothetical protein
VSWDLRVVSVKALELETDQNLAAALLDGWQPFAVTPDQRPLGMVFVYHMRRERELGFKAASERVMAAYGTKGNEYGGPPSPCWHEHPNGYLYCLKPPGHAGEHRYDDRETSGGPAT